MLSTMNSSESVEVEWQFDAHDLEVVERWLRSQPPHAALTFEPRDEKVQVDEYMDSADWRVYRASYTLRVRRSAGHAEATMKAFSTAGEGPRRRLEVNQDLPDESSGPTDTDGPVRNRLALLLGGRALRSLFVIETRRRPFHVQQDGQTLAVVTLDEATVYHAPDAPPIRRVEIEEAVPGALNRVGQFIDALRAATGLQIASHSKFQSGLDVAGLEPDLTFDLGPTGAGSEATAAEYAFATLRHYLADMLTHEPGTRLGEDPEELHQMRVATRRLRAAMSTFEPVLPLDLCALREELRWVAGALGEVRDLDVHIESLTVTQSEAEWEEGIALGPLIEILRSRHVSARTSLLEALDSERYDALVQQMSARLRAGASQTEAATPVRAFAAEVLRRRYRRFRRDARALTPASEPGAYHAVRIRGKRLRYSIEFFGGIYGRPATEFVDAVKATQDLLGEHQDSDVATAWLRGLARERGRDLPPDTLFVMGQLVERHRARMRELRAGWPSSFERVRKRWKLLRRAIEAGTLATAPDEA
jgi:CHAD domain-containing protein